MGRCRGWSSAWLRGSQEGARPLSGRSVSYTTRAVRDLKRLDPAAQRRVVDGIDRHALTGAGDVKRLRGTRRGSWRLRVGDWRVLFTYDSAEKAVVIMRVEHRSAVYRRK
ncbi:MAG: type II toxin-antitoxin system RelE/ParE family toxin [Holophagales bacterium]|nr:type II toxin-antitoxin system RelE/ParE family toxin [Holophagales bacterium]MYD21472.1 type II toxin-antitoxin system RelE/ParE family toxin [Holophagales bacterium]MYI32726.1 type II toxin-antitoxin system RelE/ParE family toxin [Holophagales bacterium]